MLFSGILLLLLALLVYGPGGDDDTHITYTAAKNLADVGQILNHSGDAVEQGSSLLHVVALGYSYKLLQFLGAPWMLTDIGPIFSLIAAVCCLPLLMSLALKSGLRQRVLMLFLLVFSVSFTYWAVGGLESTLASLCLLTCVLFISKLFDDEKTAWGAWLKVVVAVAAVILVRPEGFFIIIACLLALQVLLLLNSQSLTRVHRYTCMTIALIAVAIFVCVCLIRLYYFDQLFPQPVYAKADGFSWVKIGFGFLYFLYSMQLSIVIYTGLLLYLLYGLFFKRSKAPVQVLVALSFCCAYLAFIVVSGGDWMSGGRFFTPIIPLLILVAFFALQKLKAKVYVYVILLLIPVLETGFFALKFSTGENILRDKHAGFVGRSTQFDVSKIADIERYSWSERHNVLHLRDIPGTNALINVIKSIEQDKAFSQRPVYITSIQMGMTPYHLRNTFFAKIRLLDMRGLSTREITDCVYFSDSSRNWLGIKASYPKYFRAIKSGQCPKLIMPDIIYDLSNLAAEDIKDRFNTLTTEGYHIVYQQVGVLQDRAAYKYMDAAMFIAVSDTVYKMLPATLRDQQLRF